MIGCPPFFPSPPLLTPHHHRHSFTAPIHALFCLLSWCPERRGRTRLDHSSQQADQPKQIKRIKVRASELLTSTPPRFFHFTPSSSVSPLFALFLSLLPFVNLVVRSATSPLLPTDGLRCVCSAVPFTTALMISLRNTLLSGPSICTAWPRCVLQLAHGHLVGWEKRGEATRGR